MSDTLHHVPRPGNYICLGCKHFYVGPIQSQVFGHEFTNACDAAKVLFVAEAIPTISKWLKNLNYGARYSPKLIAIALLARDVQPNEGIGLQLFSHETWLLRCYPGKSRARKIVHYTYSQDCREFRDWRETETKAWVDTHPFRIRLEIVQLAESWDVGG